MNYLRLTPNAKTPDVLKGESIDSASTDDRSEVERWISQGFNIGLRLAGITVVDFDNKEAAREFWKKHRDLCTVTVETRRGLHAHFSGQTQGRKFDSGDIKTGPNSYVIIPPSVVDGWKYRHVTNGELLPFPEELFPQKELASQTGTIRNAVKYISHIRAVSGQGGHNATFRAVCRLRDSGFSEAEALAAMLEWNESNAEPKWTVKELLHKTKSAFSKTLRGA